MIFILNKQHTATIFLSNNPDIKTQKNVIKIMINNTYYQLIDLYYTYICFFLNLFCLDCFFVFIFLAVINQSLITLSELSVVHVYCIRFLLPYTGMTI